MGSERFVEIDFGTQVVNRVGDARGAETLEFAARARLTASASSRCRESNAWLATRRRRLESNLSRLR